MKGIKLEKESSMLVKKEMFRFFFSIIADAFSSLYFSEMSMFSVMSIYCFYSKGKSDLVLSTPFKTSWVKWAEILVTNLLEKPCPPLRFLPTGSWKTPPGSKRMGVSGQSFCSQCSGVLGRCFGRGFHLLLLALPGCFEFGNAHSSVLWGNLLELFLTTKTNTHVPHLCFLSFWNFH